MIELMRRATPRGGERRPPAGGKAKAGGLATTGAADGAEGQRRALLHSSVVQSNVPLAMAAARIAAVGARGDGGDGAGASGGGARSERRECR